MRPFQGMHITRNQKKKKEKGREKKNRTLNERIDKRTSERNILNIARSPLTYSICDYEDQTSLANFLLFYSYVFSGLPLVIVLLMLSRVILEQLAKKERKKKKPRKKDKPLFDAM